MIVFFVALATTSAFTCKDGLFSIPDEYVNDRYCDCLDGSDETKEATCNGLTFHCANKGSQDRWVPSWVIQDGVCDCCDGTDERPGICVNTCRNETAAAIAAIDEQIAQKRGMIEGRKTFGLRAQASLDGLSEQRQDLETSTAQKRAQIASDFDARITEAESKFAALQATQSRVEALLSQRTPTDETTQTEEKTAGGEGELTEQGEDAGEGPEAPAAAEVLLTVDDEEVNTTQLSLQVEDARKELERVKKEREGAEAELHRLESALWEVERKGSVEWGDNVCHAAFFNTPYSRGSFKLNYNVNITQSGTTLVGLLRRGSDAQDVCRLEGGRKGVV